MQMHSGNKVGQSKALFLTLSSLANETRWVAWQEETERKVPKNPAGGNAQVPTNPKTYGTQAAAIKRAKQIQKTAIGGTGIVLGKLKNGQHLLGIDLDSCRDAKTDAIASWAQVVIARFNTYAEVSPSGMGVKLFFLLRAADMD